MHLIFFHVGIYINYVDFGVKENFGENKCWSKFLETHLFMASLAAARWETINHMGIFMVGSNPMVLDFVVEFSAKGQL